MEQPIAKLKNKLISIRNANHLANVWPRTPKSDNGIYSARGKKTARWMGFQAVYNRAVTNEGLHDVRRFLLPDEKMAVV